MEEFKKQIYYKHFPKKNKYTKSTTLYNSDIITKPHIKNNLKNGCWTHINYNTFLVALESLVKYNPDKSNFTIVETGCNASCGVKSTNLWDKFVNFFDGEVNSVDLDENSVLEANKLTSDKTTVYHSDSVEFLTNFYKPIDLLYLDSYNMDWNNPNPSAEHHLKEFEAIKTNLHKNTIVIIDDTPKDINWMDLETSHRKMKPLLEKKIVYPIGKGTLVNEILKNHGDTLILHQYQIVWKINSLFF